MTTQQVASRRPAPASRARGRTTKWHRRERFWDGPAIGAGLAVAAVACVVGYLAFDGPNVTAQPGQNLVAIFNGDYSKAIRYADKFGLRIVETPLYGGSYSITARQALETDTDRSRVAVHICPGDTIDGQFNWRYVKAVGSACHRDER